MEKEKKKEKVFADHISDKGFYIDYMKNSQNSPIRKQTIQCVVFFLIGKRFEQILYQRRYPDGKLSLEKMFKLLVIRKKSN